MGLLEDLKIRTDSNGDGKLNFDDAKGVFAGLGDSFNGLKNKFFK